MDLAALFSFDVPAWELVFRGSVMYWFLFLVFRFVMRRDVGAVGTADILLIVLVADASQNAMAGSSTTVAEGLVLVCTLLGWTWLLDFASFHVPLVARLTDPPPVLLVRNGRVIHRALRGEHLSLDELLGELRKNGVDSPAEVRAAYMESDGTISVLRRAGAAATPPPRGRTPGT